MAPSDRFPSRDQRRGPFPQPYPEQPSPSWITISEAERPVPIHHPYMADRMSSEYDLGSSRFHAPVRMFNAPVGPSLEAGEHENAPFYVPRSRTPPLDQYQYDSRIAPEGFRPRYLPPSRDDQGDRRDCWRFEGPSYDTQYPRVDLEYQDDGYNQNRVQRHLPRDRKPSAYPYSKQSRHRDASTEGQPPNVSRPRKYTPNNQPSHRRRAPSKGRHPSRESSVSNTSQHRRQPSHDEVMSPYPQSRRDGSPQSTHSYEMIHPSPQPLPLSPISNPSVAGRSWNAIPPPTNVESTNIPQAIVILSNMLQRQSVDQIIRNWKATGQGPNPYDYPQWEGWYYDPMSKPQGP
jgi:hypothetical protein